ncbi:hypothetical protein TSUD_302070 [Trifolium subterraneum]|uniref:Uncharacterized protein n=1 Tax=Trifolium subterraneum TaxID=3900 RepID=A0A2Z6PFA6_TRISU|nr:hypothetical protein TSUD_302070 [Trifolium subterraneum]
MSSNIRDGLSYSGNPPPPPPTNSRSQRSPGLSQMQQGMAYNNGLHLEAKTGSQRNQTSAQGLSYSNTNN